MSLSTPSKNQETFGLFNLPPRASSRIMKCMTMRQLIFLSCSTKKSKRTVQQFAVNHQNFKLTVSTKSICLSYGPQLNNPPTSAMIDIRRLSLLENDNTQHIITVPSNHYTVPLEMYSDMNRMERFNVFCEDQMQCIRIWIKHLSMVFFAEDVSLEFITKDEEGPTRQILEIFKQRATPISSIRYHGSIEFSDDMYKYMLDELLSSPVLSVISFTGLTKHQMISYVPPSTAVFSNLEYICLNCAGWFTANFLNLLSLKCEFITLAYPRITCRQLVEFVRTWKTGARQVKRLRITIVEEENNADELRRGLDAEIVKKRTYLENRQKYCPGVFMDFYNIAGQKGKIAVFEGVIQIDISNEPLPKTICIAL